MIERKDHLDTRATTLLLACCAFWGLQQILIKTTVAEVPPLWQASIRMTGAVLLLWLWCLWRRVPLFERDGTLPGGLLAGPAVRGRVRLHLHRAAAHHGIAAHRVPLHLALRGGAAAAALRAGRAAARRAVARAGDRLRRRGAGLQRELRPQQRRPVARRCAGAGGRRAVGPDHAGDPHHAARHRQRREDALLSNRGHGGGVAAAVAALGERWGFAYSGYAWFSICAADRDRRLRELPGLDVDAAALPGHAHLLLHLPHAAVRAGVRRGAAGRAADLQLVLALAAWRWASCW